MSRYNLKFNKKYTNEGCNLYDVVTCDFSESYEEQSLGELKIDYINSTFDFKPGGIWEGIKIVPLEIFLLKNEECKRKLEVEYSNVKYTDWAYRIFKKIQMKIKEGKRVEFNGMTRPTSSDYT